MYKSGGDFTIIGKSYDFKSVLYEPDLSLQIINNLIAQSKQRSKQLLANLESEKIIIKHDDKLLARMIKKNTKEAEAALLSESQKVVTVPVETVTEEANEEVLEDDALKVG
ncbi:MAG: hypothetical protein MJ152_00695 [Clostridia bacterium]|nr:hypothetical protein [Clostridia bacterium]